MRSKRNLEFLEDVMSRLALMVPVTTREMNRANKIMGA